MILWANTSGGLTASLTHISPDTRMGRAHHHRPVSPQEILAGNLGNVNADRCAICPPRG